MTLPITDRGNWSCIRFAGWGSVSREIVPLVRALEGAVIDVCARFGFAAERWSEHALAWGLGREEPDLCHRPGRSQNGVTTWHRAQRVDPLDYNSLINPCGLTDRGITSLSEETGRFVGVAEAKDVLLEELSRTFDVECVPHDHRQRRSHRDRSRRDAKIRAQARLACVSLPSGEDYERVKAKVNALALNTVCKEAACPNLAECWGAGTATIMILGENARAAAASAT